MVSEKYTHGHPASVLRSHGWRTAENSAAYLLPRLRPGLDVLDVGCGPGTITIDLASIVGAGHAVGLDGAASAIEVARESAATAEVDVAFAVGDAYALRFDDADLARYAARVRALASDELVDCLHRGPID